MNPPFNPGGMVMDLVRSCYSTDMRFFPNRPDIVTRVRWFFTLPGAKDFPGHTRFGSGIWTDDKQNWPGLGEVLGAPRPWNNGQAPLGYTGEFFLGNLEDFVSGTPWPKFAPLALLRNKVPVLAKPMPGGVFLLGTGAMAKRRKAVIVGDGQLSGLGTRIRQSEIVATGAVAGSGNATLIH